jgi:fatty acid desaturase
MERAEYKALADQVRRLKPTARETGAVLARLVALSVFAVALAVWAPHPIVYVVSQILWGVACFKWFVVLHDGGHGSLFASLRANAVFGAVASVVTLIPYSSWRLIHELHHKWTGWADRDPTLAALTRRPGRLVRLAADVAWITWIPLFTAAFSFGNFWNLRKLARLARERRDFYACAASVALIVVFYVALSLAFGAAWIPVIVPGYALFLVVSDPMILSQHGQLPQGLSAGHDVAPRPTWSQDEFTRELEFPAWMGPAVFMNFNLHLTHHLWPHLPSYTLHRLPLVPPGRMYWWTWLKAAKAMRGSDYVFGAGSTVSGMRMGTHDAAVLTK